MKKQENTLTIFLKGLLMGTADIIPGISGGTIAFITGIYQRLIQGIKNTGIFLQNTLTKKTYKTKKTFKKNISLIDFNLFIPLITGIATAFLAGAWIIPGIINAYPFFVYSFFTGLILASAAYIYTGIKHKNWKGYTTGILGLTIGLTISATTSTIITTSPSIVFIFFLGMLSLTAMILPGISGAFIVFLFGQYEFMLNALRNIHLEWPYIISFVTGGIIGLLAFSHLLSYLLEKHHSPTLFFLSGLMLGALYTPVTETINAFIAPSIALLSTTFFALGILAVLTIHLLTKK